MLAYILNSKGTCSCSALPQHLSEGFGFDSNSLVLKYALEQFRHIISDISSMIINMEFACSPP